MQAGREGDAMPKGSRALVFFLIAIGVALTIQGCRDLRKHSRKEIEDYIRDRLMVETL